MFFLRHMPTSTYYSLTSDNRSSLHHKIVCFEKYEDALHVGNSLATHKHRNASFPKSTNSVFILSKKEITRDALHEDIYVDSKDHDSDFVKSITSNQLAILLIIHISSSNKLHFRSFERTNDIDIELLNKRLE
jgi:hypothetical protein